MDKFLQKLSRLVSYKTSEIHLLDKSLYDSNSWNHIETMVNKENKYSNSLVKHETFNAYENAMWTYYELLEKIFLSRVQEMKSDINSQISHLQMQKFISRYKEQNSNLDHI